MPADDEDIEVEIELCCGGLQQAIDSGAVLVVPHGDDFAVGLLCEDGKTLIKINFCPFCGTEQPSPGEA
jgi:hypothetical protein